MIDLFSLLWAFLLAQSPAQVVGLVSWHLLALLAVLGILSAFGLHFLVGHVFGFYRRKDRLARWVSWPTLLVFLVALQALLGAYLLAVRAPQLLRANLTAGAAEQMGHLLLEPAFRNAALAAQPADSVDKDALRVALRASSELDYRNALVEKILPPAQLAPGGEDAAAPRGPDVLVQIGLRWVAEPHNIALPSKPPAQPGAPAGGAPFFLPEFLLSLIDELPDGTVLPRLDWEHVAGTRFAEGTLRPLMDEYLTYLAIALAVGVGLLLAGYFLLLRRLKRIGQPRPVKAKLAPRKAPPPPPPPAPAAGKPAPVPTAPGPPAAPPAAPDAERAPGS